MFELALFDDALDKMILFLLDRNKPVGDRLEKV
jgi:hypothetical protein